MPPLVWPRTHCLQPALRAALLLSLISSSMVRHFCTTCSNSAAAGLEKTSAAHMGSLSSAMAALSCLSWLSHSGLPSMQAHCCALLFLRPACTNSSDKASPVKRFLRGSSLPTLVFAAGFL